jgi:hypothetical protein
MPAVSAGQGHRAAAAAPAALLAAAGSSSECVAGALQQPRQQRPALHTAGGAYLQLRCTFAKVVSFRPDLGSCAVWLLMRHMALCGPAQQGQRNAT